MKGRKTKCERFWFKNDKEELGISVIVMAVLHVSENRGRIPEK